MSRTERGFTLIEVMIALAIFAVMVGAIALANTQNLTAARQIQDQSEGRWVNQQALTQLRLLSLPEPGTRSQKIDFNGREWSVEIKAEVWEIDEALAPYLRRVELRATPAGTDAPADVLIAYLGEAG